MGKYNFLLFISIGILYIKKDYLLGFLIEIKVRYKRFFFIGICILEVFIKEGFDVCEVLRNI